MTILSPERCLIIGEVAQAHDGSLGTAHAYIDAIAEAGADAVKFQTHIAEAESSADEPFRVKFGHRHDRARRQLVATDVSPAYIRRACEASLERLWTDWIDLYQLHVGDLPLVRALEVAGVLDRLRDDGLIRFYAWSTDDSERAAAFGARTRAVAIQHGLNLLEDAPEMLEACRAQGLASINRSPLATGFLTGKFSVESRLAENDIRHRPPAWLPYFKAGGGAAPEWLAVLDGLREILTSGGRTLAQGALAWIWARDPGTIPIPGARSEAQVRENAGAMGFGPLEPGAAEEIDRLLGRG